MSLALLTQTTPPCLMRKLFRSSSINLLLLTEVTVPVLTTEQITVVSVEDVVLIQDQVDINRCVTQVMCQEKWLKSLGGACSEILNSIRYFLYQLSALRACP